MKVRWASTITIRSGLTTSRIVAKLGTASGKSCAFSPDSTQLATVGPGIVRVWDIATQTEIARIETDATVSALAFSPKNRYLATAGHGYVNMSDRLGAIGGTVDWRSAPGEGAEISGTIPLS